MKHSNDYWEQEAYWEVERREQGEPESGGAPGTGTVRHVRNVQRGADGGCGATL